MGSDSHAGRGRAGRGRGSVRTDTCLDERCCHMRAMHQHRHQLAGGEVKPRRRCRRRCLVCCRFVTVREVVTLRRGRDEIGTGRRTAHLSSWAQATLGDLRANHQLWCTRPAVSVKSRKVGEHFSVPEVSCRLLKESSHAHFTVTPCGQVRCWGDKPVNTIPPPYRRDGTGDSELTSAGLSPTRAEAQAGFVSAGSSAHDGPGTGDR